MANPTNAQLAEGLRNAADTHDQRGNPETAAWYRLAADRLEAKEEITEAKVQTMWVELVKRNSIAANLAGEDVRAALEAAREA
jgi:hypothetical protein